MIITVSREFGSGGRELGKRLADTLHCDYYDSEILSALAEKSDRDAEAVRRSLSGGGWREFPLSFRATLGSPAYLQPDGISHLLRQKEVIEQIGALGKDCVIVGRNADVVLEKYQPFSLFVCAQTQAKLLRCRQRAPEGENLTDKELLREMKRVDQRRAQTRELMGGSDWGRRDAFCLSVNTTGWEIKALAPAVAAFAKSWFEREQ